MQFSLNPNSTEMLRVYPHFPKAEEYSVENGWRIAPGVGTNSPCPGYVQNDMLAPPESSRAALNLDKAVEYELKHGRRLDPNMDKKKLRRIVSNRLSAHRARLRKAKYITELEKMTNHLQDMISVLTSRIESYKENQKLLLQQNESLQRLLFMRLDEANLSQIEVDKNRMEVSRLQELEKIVRKNGGGQGIIQDLISKQLLTQHCAALTFYENTLQKLGGSAHHRRERVPGSIRVAKMAPNSGLEQPKSGQGEEEQYVNHGE